MLRFHDPPCMPGTGESPEQRLARGASLAGTPGEAYLERHAIPLALAHAMGVHFGADFGGRCKDWNTALLERGPGAVSRWVRDCILLGGLQS
jgi:hypothetical protein